MPNRVQVGYLLRKYLLERDFVNHVDESWADIGRVRRVLEYAGLRIVRQGVLDVPPWPDTVMPASEVLQRLGIKSRKLEGQFSGDSWQWSTMAQIKKGMAEPPCVPQKGVLVEGPCVAAWHMRAQVPAQGPGQDHGQSGVQGQDAQVDPDVKARDYGHG